MSAEVLAFPLRRRVDLIRKQAGWFLAQDTRKGAEANLRRLLEIQRQALTSKGVPQDDVDMHVRELESAIRCQAWRLMLQPGEVG